MGHHSGYSLVKKLAKRKGVFYKIYPYHVSPTSVAKPWPVVINPRGLGLAVRCKTYGDRTVAGAFSAGEP